MSTTRTGMRAAHAAHPCAVEDAVRSASVEGLTVTLATRADSADCVAGAIDVDELIARVDGRHRVG